MSFQISDKVLEKISELYNVKTSALKAEGGFDNLFFSYYSNGKQFLIRIRSNLYVDKRPYSQIQAEVDWINYLAENGIPVVKPQQSRYNRYVEEIYFENKVYLLVSFEKAFGQYINFSDPEEWNSNLWKKMGEIVGKMHNITIRYQPKAPFVRKQLEEEIFFTTEDILDKVFDKEIINRYNQLKKWILSLPKPKSSYGLVHGDLNWGNYYIHNKRDLKLFDFDSCCYNWFIYDIAILVYSLIWEKSKKEAKEFLTKFVPHFYEGYSTFYALNDEWLALIPKFLLFHDYFLYTAISETVQAGNTTEDYQSMNKIIRCRCESEISLSYFSKDDWLKLFHLKSKN